MDLELQKYLGYGVAILAFFIGRYIKNIDKKIEDNSVKISENIVDISRMEIDTNNLKEANERASIELKNEMAKLAKDMSETSKALSRLSNITGLHDLRINNTEERISLMANEIIELRKNGSQKNIQ